MTFSRKQIVLFSLLAVGVILRLRQWIFVRSLWLDEAALANNILDRDFTGLLEPLGHNQGAPLGFLMIEKLSVTLLGGHELVLRFLPLLAGLAALLVFARIAFRALKGWAPWVGVVLFACNPYAVYYSNEVKQYGLDLLATLLVLWQVLPAPGDWSKPKKLWLLGISGAVLLWFSHAVLFVLAAIGTGLAVDTLIKRDKRQILRLGIVFFPWLLSFTALYFLSLKSLSENASLLSYWGPHFMPWPPWSDPGWFARIPLKIFHNPGGFMIIGLAIPVFLLGCVELFVRNRRWGLYVLGPFFFVLVASALKKYPFSGRLALFLLPLILLAFSAGIEWLRTQASHIPLKHAATVITLLLVAVCLWDPVRLAVKSIVYPDNKENVRPLVAELARRAKPGDHLSVYANAYQAFRYYQRRHDLDAIHTHASPSGRKNPLDLIKHLDKFKNKGRVWLLFSHLYTPHNIDPWKPFSNAEEYLLNHAQAIGQNLEHFNEEGASLHLYRFQSKEK